jgi:hypothetical protein
MFTVAKIGGLLIIIGLGIYSLAMGLLEFKKIFFK